MLIPKQLNTTLPEFSLKKSDLVCVKGRQNYFKPFT